MKLLGEHNQKSQGGELASAGIFGWVDFSGRKVIDGILNRILIYGLLAVPLTLAACFGREFWLFELCSHFRMQYLGFSVALLCLALSRKRYAIAALFGLAAAVNGAVVLQVDRWQLDGTSFKSTQKFCLFNMNSKNLSLDAVREFIRSTEPDVVLLLELTELSSRTLALQDLGYKYAAENTREDNFGIGMFSKHPLIESKVIVFGDRSVPSIAAKIDVDGVLTTVIGSHPLPPGRPEYYRARNRQLDDLAKFTSSQETRAKIVMMDMNTTPWSHVFQEFQNNSGLRDSRRGFGIQPSWPTWMPILWIPIDHIFVSDSIKVVSRKIGPALGSDHYPVTLEFTVWN